MRWMILLAVLVGGCAKANQGIGLTTGSITSPIKADAHAAAPADKTAPAQTAAAVPAPAPVAKPVSTPVAAPATIRAPLPSTAVTPAVIPVAALAPAAALPPTSAVKGGGAERVSGNLFRIQADDRKIVDHIERENYTLLRAAETTVAQGGTHFVLVSAGDQSTTGLPTLRMIVSGNRDAEFGAYFRILKIEPDTAAPIGAVSASEMIHFFGPKFGRAPS